METSQPQRLPPNSEMSVQNAQYRMMATYMPHMYALNIVSALLIAEVFGKVAPPTEVFPILTLLLAIAAYRLSYWLNPRLAETETFRSIQRTVIQAPYYGFAYFALLTYWIGNLLPYGTESQQLLACFYIALASFCAISFNANLPRCVYAVLLGGSVPLVISLVHVGTESALILAALYIANIAVQVIAVRKQNNDFVAAVRMHLIAEASRQDAEMARSDISRVANTDALTGLANRRALLNAISSRAAEDAQGAPFALGLIDLDGFKPVNDLYGHTAGDEVLFTVANRLKLSLGPDTIVARLGGDEFGFILVDPPKDAALLQGIAQLALDSIDKPIALDEGTTHITACCGIARYPDVATAPNELLQRADEALYAAKRSGRGSALIYDQELESRQTRRLLLETRMRASIADRSFDLAFQPIQDLSDNTIVSYEALARWNDPLLGPVSPGEFIPLAEQIGLIGPLSDVLFDRALQEAATWPRGVSLSFNLSPLQIHDPRFALRALATLSKHKMPPDKLIFEVTETALLKDLDRAATVIEQLRHAGIRIALDDFGVGYAGFSYLERLTFDKLKIDRSFVSGMTDDKRKRQIVKAIVEMCHSLDIKCIAEGIENDTELVHLRAIGCDAGQGYLLGRPGPPPLLQADGADVRATA
jgi:diguanylate cyclase (GGDEF)-like protein